MKKLFYRAVAIGLVVVPAVVVQGKPDKVTVCHVPTFRIMEMPTQSLPGHESHGDYQMIGPVGAPCELLPM